MQNRMVVEFCTLSLPADSVTVWNFLDGFASNQNSIYCRLEGARAFKIFPINLALGGRISVAPRPYSHQLVRG